MTTRQRWRLVRILVLGLALTAAVATLDFFGALVTFEQFTYDLRVRHFQHWFNPPDDGVVHVLIDDNSLTTIGDWQSWSRTTFADLVDEAVHDGAKEMAFDIIYSESDKSVASAVTANGAITPATDARLARSFEAARAAGVKVLLPVAMDFDTPLRNDPLLQRATDLLTGKLSMSPEALAEALQTPLETVQKFYYGTGLATAMSISARTVVRAADYDEDRAVESAFPGSAQVRTDESKQYRAALRQAKTTDLITRGFQPAVDPGDFLRSDIGVVPLNGLASAATHFAFVNYLPVADGKVRSVPLVVHAQGRLVPQFGLVMAAIHLGIDVRDPQQFELSTTSVTLRPPGRSPIRVPVRVAPSGDPPKPVGALMDIPLRGDDKWTNLYPQPGAAFVSIVELWRVFDNRRKITSNLGIIEAKARFVLAQLDPNDKAAEAPIAADDAAARVALGTHVMSVVRATKDPDFSPEGTDRLTPADRTVLDPDEAKLRAAIRTIADGLAAIPELEKLVKEYRQELRRKLDGKLLVFGWSSSADHVATSLHAECPGVVIHGAVANAILRGELWTHLPRQYATLLTILCGTLVTVAVGALTPSRAFLASAWLMLLVAAAASVALFDYGNIVIGLAGPLTAMVVCWAACTLVVTLRERFDRAMITRRFRSYVDPALVNHVLEHPEQNTLAGVSRELTVVFVDLEGFTTLTEKAGDRSIEILREFMDTLVPIIRRHGGFVNKFLGDGIMFFYGAPRPDADHARNAVITVLEMQQALGGLNDNIVARGYPKLGVRAGISTGMMLVGDAGSADASDYTVLGDAVNLAARLESANKALGTACLATARTAELCGDRFLFAPLGRLQVVGKEQAVAVCEPICAMDAASPEQRQCADSLKTVWDHMSARNVRHALAGVDQLRAFGDRTKICDLLEQLAGELQTAPNTADICIRLSGK